MSRLADAQSSVREAPQGITKAALAEILQPLCDSLESGIMLIGSDSRITTCNLDMTVMFGQTPEALVGLTTADFDALALGLMNEPPKPLWDKGLFPSGSAVRCEEFEISRPARTVARWVASLVLANPSAIS